MSSSSKSRSKPKLRKRGIYVLPSLLTAGGLFSGFFAILHTVRMAAIGGSEYEIAGYAIIIASFLDALDGRIARLMNAESEFGSQFDSIADVVSFGVAPAVLIYATALHPLDRWGWLGAFVFLACAGIRLARFNVQAGEGASRKYFKGLSSPVAAGGIALTALIEVPLEGFVKSVVMLVFTILLAGLMVSNVRFRSFKQIDANRERPIRTFLLFTVLIILVFSFREQALLSIFVVYLLWGLGEEVVLFKRRRRSDPSVPFVPFGDRDDDEDSII